MNINDIKRAAFTVPSIKGLNTLLADLSKGNNALYMTVQNRYSNACTGVPTTIHIDGETARMLIPVIKSMVVEEMKGIGVENILPE